MKTIKVTTPRESPDTCIYGPDIWHVDARGVYPPGYEPPEGAARAEVWHAAYNIAPSEEVVASWVSAVWQDRNRLEE